MAEGSALSADSCMPQGNAQHIVKHVPSAEKLATLQINVLTGNRSTRWRRTEKKKKTCSWEK